MVSGKKRETSVKVAPVVEAHTITYPISPDFWKRWDVAMALREVIANALDEDAQPRVEWNNGVLLVEDDGPGIGEHGLILGISNKGQQAIGQFGEGLQAATAVLAAKRNIGHVEIETVGYTLIPKLATHEVLRLVGAGNGSSKNKLLSYEVTPNDRKCGTKVTVECSQAEAKKAISCFRHLSEPGYKPTASPGVVVVNGTGRVYIGGVFVLERKGWIHGYDLPLDKRLQNRDRTIIDGYALERAVYQILRTVNDADILEPLVRAALEGKLSKAERVFDTHNAEPGYRKAMKTVGKRIFGDERVSFQAQAHFGSDLKRSLKHEAEAALDLKDQGYRLLDVSIDAHEFQSLMGLVGVHSAGELYKKPSLRKRDRQQTEWVALEKLADAERALLDRAVATAKALWGADAVGKYGVYSRTFFEQSDDDLHWGGFYQPTTGKIGIHVDNLRDFRATLEVLTHEVAHRLRHRRKHWDYGDRSRGFESQLCELATTAALAYADSGLAETEPVVAGVAADLYSTDVPEALEPPDAWTEEVGSDYGDRSPGFEKQLVEMTALTASRLSAAGLLPTTVTEIEADEAQKPKHPAALASELLRQRMQESGLSTYAKLAEESGVTQHVTATIVKAESRGYRASPKPKNVKAVCDALGLDWLPVWLANSGSNVFATYTRRQNGWLYGQAYQEALVAVAALRERGRDDYATIVEGHAQSPVPTDDSWLAPYRELIEEERRRIAAATAVGE